MRKERKIINTNIRLNLCDEQDRQAWEYLQTCLLYTSDAADELVIV